MFISPLIRSMRPVKQSIPKIYRLRGFKTGTLTVTAAHEIPVSTYDGNSSQSTLHVGQLSSLSDKGPAENVTRKTERFDKSVLSRLNHTMTKFTLDGKVAVVTGGARGLGYNMAQAIAEAGASAIALLDLKQDLGDQSAAELHSSTGIPVQFYKADVRDENAIAEIIKKITTDLGVPNIVINAAGIVDSNLKAEDYPAPLFRKLIDINLTGTFLTSQACARAMMASKTPGSIICIGSIAGTRVLHPQEQCAYNASKAAVIHLAKSLAAEWAPHGIRVNTISPGYMDTALNREADLEGVMKHWSAMTPMHRLGQPDELNGLAVFLASDASAFVTGSNIMCDGGYSCY